MAVSPSPLPSYTTYVNPYDPPRALRSRRSSSIDNEAHSGHAALPRTSAKDLSRAADGGVVPRMDTYGFG